MNGLKEATTVLDNISSTATTSPEWYDTIGVALADQNPLILGDRVIIIIGAEIICYNLQNGAVCWRFALPGGSLRGQRAVIDGEHLYTTTSGSINQLTTEPPHDSMAICLKLNDGALCWQTALQATARQHSITVGHTGFADDPAKAMVWIGAHQTPWLSCVLLGLDAATGQICTRFSLPPEYRPEALMVLDNHQLLLGTMTCLLRWNPLEPETSLTLLFNEEVYTMERHVAYLDRRLTPDRDGPAAISAMVDKEGLRHIAMLSAEDGHLYWTAPMLSGMAGVALKGEVLPASPPEGRVCVVQDIEGPRESKVGMISCYDLHDGHLCWTTPHHLDIRNATVRSDGEFAYVRGLEDNHACVVVYDIKNGRIVQRLYTEIEQRCGIIAWLSVAPALPDEMTAIPARSTEDISTKISDEKYTRDINVIPFAKSDGWIITIDLDYVECFKKNQFEFR